MLYSSLPGLGVQAVSSPRSRFSEASLSAQLDSLGYHGISVSWRHLNESSSLSNWLTPTLQVCPNLYRLQPYHHFLHSRLFFRNEAWHPSSAIFVATLYLQLLNNKYLGLFISYSILHIHSPFSSEVLFGPPEGKRWHSHHQHSSWKNTFIVSNLSVSFGFWGADGRRDWKRSNRAFIRQLRVNMKFSTES